MNTRRKFPYSTLVWTLISVGLLTLAIGGYLNPLLNIALTPFVQAQTWLATRYEVVSNFITAPRDVAELNQRNQELTAENARLRSQIVDLQQQSDQLRQLSALLDFARANPVYEYTAATVIGRDPSPFLKYVIINTGSDNDVRRGMAAVTDQGLVGRVDAVNASAARIQLITDAASVVNVRLEKSGAEAVLKGSLTGDLVLDLIPQDVNVEPGELVFTSGLGGQYPPNILIGQVVSVRSRSFDLFQTASIQPLVDFSDLSIVLIIRNFRPVDISPLVPSP